MPGAFIHALGLIKQAAAGANKKSGRLERASADAIATAAGEVADGRHDAQFPVDVFQTGSGTSTNMNANEVIAARAEQVLIEAGGDVGRIHPNDHVNMSQSSNDVIPSAMNVAGAMAIRQDLVPALRRLACALTEKAKTFDGVLKIGRTHLMDAVPVRLGQELAGYAAQLDAVEAPLSLAVDALCELPIGGTAVGTGLNAPADFGKDVCRRLSSTTGMKFVPARNRFAAQGARDAAVTASAALRSVALVMGKIASDVRLLASGPRCGLGELILPALQPGSSIMPGKVNPVICESVIQVACQVVGCDAAIAAAATGGVGSILELNVGTTVIATNLLWSIRLLANAAAVFADKCIDGLQVNQDRCEQLIEQSLSMITALSPVIGYDAAAEVAKEAYETGKTIREVCLARQVLPASQLDQLLDARRQTEPD
jgi:fumarate hydratase class II